ADEIVFLDISASTDKRDILIDVVARTASEIFIPFTVGGGVRSVADISRILANGADKVALNTNAVLDPGLVSLASGEFGAQCVVVAVDAKWNGEFYEVFIYGGRRGTGMDVMAWVKRCEELGCGEILLTSIERDGTKSGFDTRLIREVSGCVNVPVIASGGARDQKDFFDAFMAGADAALAASIFHYGKYTVGEIKEFLKKKGVVVR
ncbi:MAG: imidazole glycerol phosphate synthase subunit HisF, partial [Syntrophobacterales bacterium]